MSSPLLRMRAAVEASWVRRWHTMPEAGHPETVGHHMFQVAWFIIAFCPRPSAELLIAALTHDRHERWSGDVPSPGRRAVPAGQMYEDGVEARVNEALGKSPDLTSTERLWLELADAACAFYWCAHQRGLGNSHVDGAYAGCLRAVRELIQINADKLGYPGHHLMEAVVSVPLKRIPESITGLEEIARDNRDH